MGAKTPDAGIYREMEKPFPNVADAANAIDKFWDEVYALRVKHRIADVHLVIAVNAIGDTGNEGRIALNGHIGSQLNAESMIAYAIGMVQAERQQMIAELVSAKGKRIVKPHNRE